MKNWAENLGYIFLIIILAIYPLYASLIAGADDNQLIRHTALLKGNSPFFNPWQYRVLAPYIIESIAIIVKQLYLHPISEKDFYLTIFKCVRFLQHLLIFGVAWKFYTNFTSNKILILLSLATIAASMGSATFDSDFSFNTYFDILFYLFAIYIVFAKKNITWFLPLIALAALNRETSLLIPFLLFINYQQFYEPDTRKKYWCVFLSSLATFTLIFVLIRFYYGYQSPAPIGIEAGLPMLLFNLTDPPTIQLLFAMLNILPILALFNIRKVNIKLQILFWLLIPAWFSIHFSLVWARETRLFLVPLILVFIPIILELIQKSFDKAKTT